MRPLNFRVESLLLVIGKICELGDLDLPDKLLGEIHLWMISLMKRQSPIKKFWDASTLFSKKV